MKIYMRLSWNFGAHLVQDVRKFNVCVFREGNKDQKPELTENLAFENISIIRYWSDFIRYEERVKFKYLSEFQ